MIASNENVIVVRSSCANDVHFDVVKLEGIWRLRSKQQLEKKIKSPEVTQFHYSTQTLRNLRMDAGR